MRKRLDKWREMYYTRRERIGIRTIPDKERRRNGLSERTARGEEEDTEGQE